MPLDRQVTRVLASEDPVDQSGTPQIHGHEPGTACVEGLGTESSCGLTDDTHEINLVNYSWKIDSGHDLVDRYMVDQLLHVQHVDNPNDDTIEHGLRSVGNVLSILPFAPVDLALTPSKVSLNCVKRALGNRCGYDNSCDLYGSARDLDRQEGRRTDPHLGRPCDEVDDPRTRIRRRSLRF